MATCTSVLAWKIPLTEDPGGLSPGDCKESDTTEWLSTHTHTHTHTAWIKLNYHMAYFNRMVFSRVWHVWEIQSKIWKLIILYAFLKNAEWFSHEIQQNSLKICIPNHSPQLITPKAAPVNFLFTLSSTFGLLALSLLPLLLSVLFQYTTVKIHSPLVFSISFSFSSFISNLFFSYKNRLCLP